MTIETAIEAALFGRVRSLSLTGAPPLAWPNRSFTPPGTYIRVDHLPNRTTRLFIGSTASHLRQGILQLTAVTPLQGGPEPATELAGAIAADFPPDLALYRAGVKVRVQRVPDVMPPEKTDTSWTVRVDVYYDSLSAPRVGTASLTTTMGALLLDGIGGVPAQGILAATLGAVVVTASGFVFDADAWAWRNAVVANGGTVSDARLSVVSTFIRAEKAAGTWALTDDYWVLWAENAIQALTSLKQRRLAVAVNSPTFTADRDYTFNGSTNYLNAGFIPSTHGIGYTGLNQRLAVYERTNLNSSGGSAGASISTGARIFIVARNSSALTAAANNSSGGISFAISPADSRGLKAISRADGGTTVKGHDRGVALTDVTVGAVGTGIPNIPLFIGAINNGGTPSGFRACSVGFAAIGGPLSAPQELAQYDNVQAWATAVGAQV